MRQMMIGIPSMRSVYLNCKAENLTGYGGGKPIRFYGGLKLGSLNEKRHC